MSFEVPSGFRNPDPLIKRRRFWLPPAVSGCVPCSVGRQCFAYLITYCCRRSIPVDCSFAPHKRHLPLPAPANLLQASPTEHLGLSELETRCLAAGALTLARPILGRTLETRVTGSSGGSDDPSDCVPHMWHRAARARTGLRSCGSLIARLPAPHVDHRLAPVLNQNGAALVLVA
jgi:hypothetical protein